VSKKFGELKNLYYLCTIKLKHKQYNTMRTLSKKTQIKRIEGVTCMSRAYQHYCEFVEHTRSNGEVYLMRIWISDESAKDFSVSIFSEKDKKFNYIAGFDNIDGLKDYCGESNEEFIALTEKNVAIIKEWIDTIFF
jgi:hypothetical protein